ncbi:hypothetical protein QUA83_12555 [Microcoleus sp. K1-B1]|uniref:hypothetical protein n=1 Tax=Microcoleus sp. K1-B6 TaxID=2818787 RepID=UPI002FD85585
MRDIASVGSEKKEINTKKKTSAIVALAFEVIDESMKKFNKRTFDTNYLLPRPF